jgi:hypothetical protein
VAVAAAFDTAAIHIILPNIGLERPLRSKLIPERREVQADGSDSATWKNARPVKA